MLSVSTALESLALKMVRIVCKCCLLYFYVYDSFTLFVCCLILQVRFWVAVNEYKAKFDEESCPPSSNLDTDDEESDKHDADTAGGKESLEAEIHSLASDIYDSFVQDTEHQVNLSSRHKNDLKEAIDSKQLRKDTFDAAQKEIFGVMARDSYPRYLGVQKRQKR